MIYRDLYITGSLVSEGLPAAPGDIRAYEVKTGKVRWQFHTIPTPGQLGRRYLAPKRPRLPRRRE